MLAAFSCHALAPEDRRIAAGADERVAALNRPLRQGEPVRGVPAGHAGWPGAGQDSKALIDAPDGDEPIVNNRMRREIDAALAGWTWCRLT